jgi:hypothetical protein
MSDTAVSTNELTTSFGWESRQVFEQQDVQELSRVLMERMEIRMKGTEAEKTLPEMFVGQMKTFIRCINVDYESSRKEDFWDLQLNVRGNKTMDDSFKDYIQVETLEGDNKYHADKFGLQDAKKGVIFEKLPQVLHLQLKRFEYDFMHDTMMKVYDRYEFPEVWDASPYLSDDADRSESYIYHLHGVLVHSGDLNAGHYYAFLKPKKGGQFFKFDDDRVTPATNKEAMDENFGGEFDQSNGNNGQQRNPYTRTWSKQRYMSAYMLVYIRETRLDSVLGDLTEDHIPQHLGKLFPHVGQRFSANCPQLERLKKKEPRQREEGKSETRPIYICRLLFVQTRISIPGKASICFPEIRTLYRRQHPRYIDYSELPLRQTSSSSWPMTLALKLILSDHGAWLHVKMLLYDQILHLIPTAQRLRTLWSKFRTNHHSECG